MGCYILYSEEEPGRAEAPPSPLLAVPNVTTHPSTASVPITVLLYNDSLLCGFSVAIKGLTKKSIWTDSEISRRSATLDDGASPREFTRSTWDAGDAR